VKKEVNMRKVDISSLKNDEILGKSIIDEAGRTLLNRGVKLTPQLIARLRALEINSVYIDDPFSSDIEIQEILTDQTTSKLRSGVKDVTEKIIINKDVNYARVSSTLNLVMEDIMERPEVMIAANEIRSKNDIVFAHSVNVCSMATVLGIKVGLDMAVIKEMSIGALLHDVGKIEILKSLKKLTPNGILKLTHEERDFLEKNHSKQGYELLGRNVEFNPIAKVTVLMHHELCDGSGFPMGIKKGGIHASARIVAICNTFDNIVYGTHGFEKMSGLKALEYLNTTPNFYDREYVKLFSSLVAVYPNGTTVNLNIGEKGVVVKQNQGMPSRPVVRVFEDKNGRTLMEPYEIDLMRNLTIFINDE
jgi:HD-GYP domain-containing protein (c-di-GMP phosphodiesterase class II)